MKVLWLGLLILATPALGQHAGGLSPLQPIPPLGDRSPVLRHGPFFENRFGRLGFGAPVYPLVWPGYFGEEAYSYPPKPNIVVIPSPPPAAPQAAAPAPAPKPAEPVIHEYHFSPAEAVPATSEEQQAFVIALKNGSKDSAVALWVQGRTLSYIDTDGNERHVALSEVDRTRMQKLNREQHLPLSVPPAAP